MYKQVQFKTIGMNRDLSESSSNSKFAYENMNIRITPTNNNTLFSITNEKGNKTLNIEGVGACLEGCPIGQAVVDDEWVIFTTDNNGNDKIYKLWFVGDILKGKLLYSGNLNFSTDNPIETLEYYENGNIKKVYWVDGINQTRVINISANDEIIEKWKSESNPFDFTLPLSFNEEVEIKKSTIAGGVFTPGVIQYAFTYYNIYGQESNIFHITPLYYISYLDRGANPEDKVSNSFTISIKNIDTAFDYIRIYSIHRSSIEGTPEVKRVADLSTSNNNIIYIDNGISGDYIDPTELLYVGGEEVVGKTIAQKDNTLFLGNITLKRKTIDKTIKDSLRNGEIKFESISYTQDGVVEKVDLLPEPSGYYPYKNQLFENSNNIKTFKYLEYYRLGLQAQHYTGKWSEPIWINDVRNEVPIDGKFYGKDTFTLPTAIYNLDNKEVINSLIERGYIRVRPVAVFPTINDREIICQGVLCPTVYNVGDRYNNAPFVQSSWFVRPNLPFDYSYNRNKTTLGNPDGGDSIYSRYGIMLNDNEGEEFDVVNYGSYLESRHNKPIPNNTNRNAEIQCIKNAPTYPYVDMNSNIDNWVKENSQHFYVDQSIVTLHSPDIEFDDDVKNMDMSNLKLRIVGMTPITGFISDIDIQTSTPVNPFKTTDGKIEFPKGFYKETIGATNIFSSRNEYGTIEYGNSHFGYRSLTSGIFWLDEIANSKVDNNDRLSTGFVIYPWHRNGSLNNSKAGDGGYRSAMLDKKKMSNLRYSYNNTYLSKEDIWNAYDENIPGRNGITGISIFDSNEMSVVKIPSPSSEGEFITYYGNVDKVVTPTSTYPIVVSGGRRTDNHSLFTDKYDELSSLYSDDYESTDPVRIKYKSTPHAVLALKNHGNWQRVLPTTTDKDYLDIGDWNINYIPDLKPVSAEGKIEYFIPFWMKGKPILQKWNSQDIIQSQKLYGSINTVCSPQHGWLWLGELYNDNIENRFGGTTEEAFENNLWLPCGKPIHLLNPDKSAKDSVTLYWTEGDTYYQRYDHIKTYPYSLEDQNAVTDIVSFMCETKINLDGRYDRNRGLLSNLTITPENFNKINNVYSQNNNFFNYRGLNQNRFNLDNFNNTITWTKTKTAGELVDTWTNITLASTLDLDGDKGPVTSLKNVNDKLIAFQPSGISQIMYNDNVQIASTEGVPIEIANSGKVIGKRYFTDQVGCTNKWSICSTPYGLFFIDDLSKGIYSFSEGVNDVSNKLGFDSWIRENSKVELWDPLNFKSFVTYYDKVNKELLFINKDNCLAYSGNIGQFTSFYSYEGTPYFTNIKDKCLSINKGYGDKYKVWLRNGGDYNMFYGEYKPFYTTVLVNPDMHKDKTFSTVEFRSDSWGENNTLVDETFDTLKVWNEYQEGESDLYAGMGVPSTLKRKFRIWRANIPRDGNNGRDRIRNTWAYVKLSKEQENINRTTLHDLIVTYFE